SPSSTSRSMPSTALVSLNDFVRPAASMAYTSDLLHPWVPSERLVRRPGGARGEPGLREEGQSLKTDRSYQVLVLVETLLSSGRGRSRRTGCSPGSARPSADRKSVV